MATFPECVVSEVVPWIVLEGIAEIEIEAKSWNKLPSSPLIITVITTLKLIVGVNIGVLTEISLIKFVTDSELLNVEIIPGEDAKRVKEPEDTISKLFKVRTPATVYPEVVPPITLGAGKDRDMLYETVLDSKLTPVLSYTPMLIENASLLVAG